MTEPGAGRVKCLTEVSAPAAGARPVADVAARVFSDPLFGAGDGIVVVDGQGRMQFVNASLERLFGYEQGQLSGRQVELLMPEQRETTHVQELGGLADLGTAELTETPCRSLGYRSDGSELELEIRREPLATAGGTWTIASVRDDSTLDSDERQPSDALIEEDMRIATRLGDTVIRDLFGAGLHMQSLLQRTDGDVHSELSDIVGDLDQIIHGIRDVVFGLERGHQSGHPN